MAELVSEPKDILQLGFKLFIARLGNKFTVPKTLKWIYSRLLIPKINCASLNSFGSALLLYMGSDNYVNHLRKLLQELSDVSRSNLTNCAHDVISRSRETLILFTTTNFPSLLDCLH